MCASVSRVNAEFNGNQNYVHMRVHNAHTNSICAGKYFNMKRKKRENVVIEKQELKNFEYVQYIKLVAREYIECETVTAADMVPLFPFHSPSLSRCVCVSFFVFLIFLASSVVLHRYYCYYRYRTRIIIFCSLSCVHVPLLCSHSSSCCCCCMRLLILA